MTTLSFSRHHSLIIALLSYLRINNWQRGSYMQRKQPRDIFKMIDECSNTNLLELSNLLAAGVDLTQTNSAGKTPIQYAHDLRKWDVVDLIAEKTKTNQNDDAKYGYALYTAVKENRMISARLLLQAGAATTWYEPNTRMGLLHLAIKNKNLLLVQLLLQHGASLEYRNEEGQEPIRHAARFKHWDAVELIMKAKPDCRAGYGGALLYAVYYNQEALALQLINTSPDFDNRFNNTHNYILHEAVLRNKPTLVRALLEHGAKLENKNKAGQTALDLAQRYKYLECMHVIQAFQSNGLKSVGIPLSQQCEQRYTSLMGESVDVRRIPAVIIELIRLHSQWLQADLDTLTAQSSDAASQPASSNAVITSTLSDVGRATLNPLINNLLRFPYQPVPAPYRMQVDALSKEQHPEAQHVQAVMQRIDSIAAYIDKIRHGMLRLHDSIQSTKFKITNGLGVFVEGVPRHIKQLLSEVSKLNAASSAELVLGVYINVITILDRIKPSARRHPATSSFYEGLRNEIQQNHFKSPVLLTDIYASLPLTAPAYAHPASSLAGSNKMMVYPQGSLWQTPTEPLYPQLEALTPTAALLTDPRPSASLSPSNG